MSKKWRSQASLLRKEAIVKGIFPSDIVFSPEEADKFLDYIIDQTGLKSHIQIIRMKKAIKNVRGLGLASGVTILKPVVQFTGGTTMVASTDLVQSNTQLIAKKARGCVPIYDDDLEDGVEGDSFADHLLRMIAAKVANEIEEALLFSSPAPSEATQLNLQDIWMGVYNWLRSQTFLTKTATRLVDASDPYIASWNDTTKLWNFKFGIMLKRLASKYKKDLKSLRFFVSPAVEEDYVNAIASRGTVLGDKAILSGEGIGYKGIPIVPVPLLATDLPVVGTGTNGSTTVDADSAAGQKVLNVTATTNFTVGDKVLVGNRASATLGYKAEVCEVASIETGVSLTMVANLLYAHTAANAETVVESTLDGSFILLTPKDNIIMGLRRILRIETERQAANERTLFYFSLRGDFAVENPEAAILYDDIKQRS
jgi:hypothetical protein